MTGTGTSGAATATEQLADVVVARGYDDSNRELYHDVKRLVLDYLGVGLAGSRTGSGQLAAGFALELAGPAESHLFGRPAPVTAVHAAFANAISSHSVELDDVDELALFHYSPPIVSAALAIAERQHSTGREFLVAVLSGCETMNRLSRATNPALRDRGFHTTPACGVFGATVAAGVLLQLSAAELVSALGLAGAQAGGLMEMYGTSMQKRFNPGPAARNGVTAALLAKAGFTGADSIIDGERGFAAAFAGAFDATRFLDELGRKIPVAFEFKPYSCARPIHNAIDAVLELRQAGLRAEDLATATVHRHPDWAHYHVITEPRTFHEAQVSLPYSAAIALVYGNALPEHYARVEQGDPAAAAVSKRVSVVADPTLRRGVSCRVVATTVGGREFVAEVDYPRGSLQRPLTDAELEAKFRSLAGPSMPEARVSQVAHAVWTVDEFADLRQLGELLSGTDDANDADAMIEPVLPAPRESFERAR